MNFKLLRRGPIYLLLLSVVCSAVLAQQPAQPDAPRVDQLREHISYLASDKLEGRRTGSAGANLAAEYIAREFSRYGLRRSVGVDLPGMSILEADSPRRYLQEFPYVAGIALGKGNILSIQDGSSSRNLRLGEDWMPLGFSSDASLDNPKFVDVGYGITAAELKYDDYANDKAKGKVAIARSGTPGGDNPHGQFARYEGARWKAIAARSAGAKALIIIAHEEKFSDDRLSQLSYDNSAGDAGIPVLAISKQAQLWLLDRQVDAPLSPAIIPTLARPEASHSLRKISIEISRNRVSATNVVGILDGSDPQLKQEAIVIGAHYDHLGLGGEGSLAPRSGEIHHGADDNASGVAGVLELARIFSSQRPRPRRTIIFIAFSGEEEGLLGSNYYVNHPIVPLANVAAMINMDMIGRMKDNKLIVGGVGTAQDWRAMIESANVRSKCPPLTLCAEPINVVRNPKYPSLGSSFPEVVAANAKLPPNTAPIHSTESDKQFQLTLNEDGYGPSDHSMFYSKQVPVLFFWTGSHEDYHKPSDTADKINYVDEARVVTMVARLVSDIDKNDKRPTYTVAKTESTGRSTGFRVYLGTIPNYADASDGLLLDGVRDDSPAAKAGLKAGDKIVKLAGRDVRNVYDYTYALGEMKAGQEYEVEIMRGGERLRLKLTPLAKKP